MQIFDEILKESQGLPLASWARSKGILAESVRTMIDRGLSAFAQRLNQDDIYLPLRYAEYVFYGASCEMDEIRRAQISEKVYAEATYGAMCAMQIVWVDRCQEGIGQRTANRRLFLPLPLQSQKAFDAYFAVWNCILNDLEQYKGSQMVLSLWHEQKKATLIRNQISSKDVLVHKIATGKLECDYYAGSTWSEWLRDLRIANEVAEEVMLSLANIMKEVNK